MGAEGSDEAGASELGTACARLAKGQDAHRVGSEPLAALGAREADDVAAEEVERATPRATLALCRERVDGVSQGLRSED